MYTNYLFIFAPLMYAFSIYVDMFTYHLKFNLNDEKNYRYLFSLINVFQYSSRAFVLIFAPIMAYYTETIRDKKFNLANDTFVSYFGHFFNYSTV